jgi:DNA-binding CsgD family transcriptional regulator
LNDARRLGTARFLARALRAVAACAGRDRAIVLLREADALLADSDASLERARTLLALGSALRRRGRRRAARGPLREAADLAERCGAAPLVVLAQAEAIAAGARPRRVALRGPASLTPSERRVADLAAAGRSNREIAGELTVTINTVESHLAHVYRKLGIRSRADLRVTLSA